MSAMALHQYLVPVLLDKVMPIVSEFIYKLNASFAKINCEPVWPSGKALGR